MLFVLPTVLLAGCGGGTAVSPTPAVTVNSAAPSSSAAEGSSAAEPSRSAQPTRRRIVLLDPGHNGGNAANPAQINKKVPDGRKGTKPCNTTGTATNDGFPEHEFNWDVAVRVADVLESSGVTVVMSRKNDTGVGPCVDARGELADKVNADAAVSIHADGAPPAGKGFHVAYSSPPLNASQGQPSISLATALRDSMRGAGLLTSTYLGKAGLAPRADLAGLNLSKRPTALIECANMRNPDEAIALENAIGQQRYANAIAAGILAWLGKH